MTLQGGLDSFPLPDVLRLLAATGKTGGLHVVGPTASGSIWVVDGRIEHTALGGEACDPAQTVFTLLRNVEGTFRYEVGVPGTVPPSSEAGPFEVEGVLAAAAVLLQEWDELGRVVPGADARLHLSPELARPVRLAVEEWAVIVAVGSGTCVQDLATALRVPEIVAVRRARDLVVAGLLTATPADPHAAPLPIEDLVAAVGGSEVPRETKDRSASGDAAERPRPVASSPEIPEPIVPGTLGAEDWAEAEVASSLAAWNTEAPRGAEPSWEGSEPSWGVSVAADPWQNDPWQAEQPQAEQAWAEQAWDSAPPATIGAWSPDAWTPGPDPTGAGRPAAVIPVQPMPTTAVAPPAGPAAPPSEDEDVEVDRSLLLRFLGAVED